MNDAPLGSKIVRHVRRWPRRVVLTVAAIALVLIGVRLALPFVVKRQINERLAGIPGYWGHVDDVGLAIWRGAYKLDGVAISKLNGAAREPFVAVEHIDFSIAWRELFHGKFVSDIHVTRPEITFVAAGTDEASQKDLDRRWQAVIKDVFPLEITHLEVTHGMIRYQDLTKQPHVDLFVKDMHVVATGLRNRPDESGEEFPAKINVDGVSLGGGKVGLYIEADPLAAEPHFHLSAKIDGVNLPDLNESMRAYANVDVSRGTFRMAAEMAGKDGGFQGYVKPFFEDLNFNNIEDKNKRVLTRLWENVVQGLAWLVKNKARDQVGTRIPFQGRFGDAKFGLGTTIANLFRHGFIRAFNPTVEGTVHADNVLPTGGSANGRKVADTKNETDAPKKGSAAPRGAGAPTGDDAEPRKKK